jgi:hypothetical protein
LRCAAGRPVPFEEIKRACHRRDRWNPATEDAADAR